MLRLHGVLHSLRTATTSFLTPPSKIPPFLLKPSFLTPFIRTTTTTTTTTDPSLTLYFLQKSCGLSASAALSASKRINLKSTKKPHAVLSLLKDYNFTPTHIARLISTRPALLLSDAAKTLKPKLVFYHHLRISDDLPRLLSSSSDLLVHSLPNRILPNLALLRTILNCDAAASVRRTPSLLLTDLNKTLVPNVEHLRAHGVSETAIAKLITTHARVLLGRYCDFDRALAVVKSTGISLSSPMFARALGVLGEMSEPMWREKIENYMSLGWTEEMVMKAFELHPYCLSTSMEKVRRNMGFFAARFDWSPEYVSVNPAVLSLSFEKRIVPRHLVFRILERKGLVKGPVLSKHLMLPEMKFVKKYVEGYRDEAPEVVDAASGMLCLSELED